MLKATTYITLFTAVIWILVALLAPESRAAAVTWYIQYQTEGSFPRDGTFDRDGNRIRYSYFTDCLPTQDLKLAERLGRKWAQGLPVYNSKFDLNDDLVLKTFGDISTCEQAEFRLSDREKHKWEITPIQVEGLTTYQARYIYDCKMHRDCHGLEKSEHVVGVITEKLPKVPGWEGLDYKMKTEQGEEISVSLNYIELTPEENQSIAKSLDQGQSLRLLGLLTDRRDYYGRREMLTYYILEEK